MSSVRQEKQIVIDAIKETVEKSTAVFIANYRGISVTEMTGLRKELSLVNSKARVCKNTLARIAFDSAGIKYPEELLVGPTMIIDSGSDLVATSKVMVKYANDLDAYVVKGGLMQKDFLSEKDIQRLSKLPGRDVLLSKLIGSMKAPINGFVSTLSGPMRGFVYVLKAIREKKLEVNP